MGDTQIYDYHYGAEADQYSFYRIPKILILDDQFKQLSTDAKLLYGLMLDRMSLSMKNGWFDDDNRVFIHFALDDIMEQLNCQHGKAIKLLAELDMPKGIGLIRRVKQGQGRPAKIYVLKASSRLPINGTQDFSKSEVQTSKYGNPRFPKNECADFRKSVANYNNKNNTEKSYTHPSINRAERTEDRIDMEGLREKVKENIEYEILIGDNLAEKERLDELVDLIVETLCMRKSTLTISGNEYSAGLVKEKLERINRNHIEYVFDCLSKNTTQIRNIKSYLMATLFNAPSTVGNYYAAQVNHDFYASG